MITCKKRSPSEKCFTDGRLQSAMFTEFSLQTIPADVYVVVLLC